MGKVKRELFEPQQYEAEPSINITNLMYMQDTECLEEQLERAEFELEVAHKHWSWLRHKLNRRREDDLK
jgi:hypothetical protein